MQDRTPTGAAPILAALLLALLVPLAATAQRGDAAAPFDDEAALLEAKIEATKRLKAKNPPTTPQLGRESVGPDVTIIHLDGIDGWSNGEVCPPAYDDGVGDPDLCRGYTVGTDSCNVGSVPVDWCDNDNGFSCRDTTDDYHPVVATETDHSVISQNLYRLKDGRFQQIGLGFLKHGFVSTNSFDAGCVGNDGGKPTTCIGPPEGGDQLGVGCTDFYWAGLNGSRPMGRRSDVNVADGDHPQDGAGGETDDDYDQRIVVREADLDPDLNPGALYWVEGMYTVRDDARSGPSASPPAPIGEAGGTLNAWLGENALNNASYRAVTVSQTFSITETGPTVREKAAIHAWQEADPAVEIVNADRQTFFPGDPLDPPAGPGFHPDHWVVERFHAARRVTETEGGPLPYHYEYAIQNLNSDTAADGFVVDFPGSVAFANVGVHDIPHHSGEPYDTSDWTVDVDGPNGTITWSAVDAGADTNALRWGTTFTFWFDSDAPPDSMEHELDLFKIDEPLDVPFPTVANEIFVDGFESGDTGGWDSTVD